LSSLSSCRVRNRRAPGRSVGSEPDRPPRVALVHDYLNQRGGAERVFAHVARAYPDAPIYTSLFDPRETGDLVDAARLHVSALRHVPFANRAFRLLAPLYPYVFEHFDLSAYDLIVSTTTTWAKGVRFRSDAVHVCYIHNVARFAYAFDSYVGDRGPLSLARAARPLLAPLVAWDRRAARRPTAFIANSRNVAGRVRRFYGREAAVAHCPIDVDRFSIGAGDGAYALVVARLLPYKRVDLAIRGCALAGVPLVIVGTGPEEAGLRRLARGTATRFAGAVSDAELSALLGAARVAIVAGEEDYGLVPLEANAAGRPAIAYARGGALETVVPGVTGELFWDANAASLAAALRAFDDARFDARALRRYAERFAPGPFIERFRGLVDDAVRSAHAERAEAGARVAAT